MSKKRRIIISIVIALFVIVVLAVILVVRNINEKPPVIVDQTPQVLVSADQPTEAPRVVATAPFRGVDDVHWARGSIEVIEAVTGPTLSFKDDFEVAQGPDLFVYLSPNAAGEGLGEYASLGQLKANKGAQEYVLPTNYTDYKTVVIWCRAFSVTFATAALQ